MPDPTRFVFFAGTHIPFHDRELCRMLVRFIAAWRPDEVIHLGDLLDFPTPSRWGDREVAAFRSAVDEDCAIGKAFLGSIREGHSGTLTVIAGAHDLRPANSPIADTFSLAESLGMIPIAGPYEFHPGWIACCGDALRLDQQAGLTALNGAKRFGKNVICGHTHRLGKISYSEGYEQNITRTLTGVEVGHLSDRRHVESSNSQQGIAIGEVVDGELIVTPIPARRKGFRLPGQLAI